MSLHEQCDREGEIGEYSYSSTVFLGRDKIPVRLLTNSAGYNHFFERSDATLPAGEEDCGSCGYSAVFEETSEMAITYHPGDRRMFVRGSPGQLGSSIPYILYTFSEAPRQERGSFTFHAAAVSREGGAVLITGSKGSGKTALAMALCLEHKYNLVGNDVVIIGKLKGGRVGILGGDGVFKPRRMTMREFPQYAGSIVFDDTLNDFEAKAIVPPENLGVSVEPEQTLLRNVVQVFVHADQSTGLRVTAPPYEALRLNLYENSSRYIRGVATPIFDKSGRFLCSLPSFDSRALSQNRMLLLERIIQEVGVSSVSGGNLREVAEYVESQRRN